MSSHVTSDVWLCGCGYAGVYDVTIHLQRLPHLEDHAKKALSSILVVHDIMTQNPIVFREVCDR